MSILIHSTAGRLLISAGCILSMVSCGGEMLRTGRAPVYLSVNAMTASAGGSSGAATAFLLSDVQVLIEQDINGVTVFVPTVFNDSASATIQVNLKNPEIASTTLNNVTLTRYHVEFRRADGRNTPGIDVPYAFDGGLGLTIPAGSASSVAFEIVRHQAKLEPPLRNLTGSGVSSVNGLGFISTIAEITFYGHDQNGNEVSVTGRIDVQFADFGDDR
jgi:hypothetical protein